MKNKALFLDRDGVINIDFGYVGSIERFQFMDGIFELCEKAQKKGYLIIVITNQAGIARGFYSEEEFHKLNDWMINEFAKKNIKIEKTYYCPHHVEGIVEKYKKPCNSRKPNPGMILKACEEFNIDPKESILIGDKESDIEAGKNAKIKTNILIDSSLKKVFA